MNVPSGRLQFFALEAGDYLDRLGLIVGRPAPPDPDELVRLTRALRGAALMAGLAPFSQAAGALEQIAKAHRAGQWTWSGDETETVQHAVEILKRLARQSAEWSDADSVAANRLATQLVDLLNRGGVEPAAPPSRRPSDELQASVRIFVAREGAMIAGTLEHAAQALELGRPAETAEVVLQRMQPLRGLAMLPTLAPLPEFLDAIELAMRVVRDGAAPPLAPRALRRVAATITRIAREIADHAHAGVDLPETIGAARELLAVFGRDDDVVDIRTLFAAGDPAPIVRPGSPPVHDHGDPLIEMVSLADRLRQGADQLITAPSTTARILQLHALVSQLRPLAHEAGTERPSLGPLFSAIGGAITQGRAEAAIERFADLLREAADRLARIAEARDAVFLDDEVTEIAAAFRLDQVPISAAPAPPAAAEPIPATPVEWATAEPVPAAPVASAAVEPVLAAPVESAARLDSTETPVVPIESLAFDEPVPIAALAPEPGPTPFASSFSTYFRLRRAPRIAPEPIAATGPSRSEPAIPLQESGVVPIVDLLYRGRRALERADVVRLELSDALRSRLAFEDIQPLVSELIDLVPLALAE